MSLKAEGLAWTAEAKRILDGVDFEAAEGMVIGLLGPNGSGKSSLLNCLAGLRPPAEGRVLVDGQDIRTLGRRAIGRRMAVIAQTAATEFDPTVAEVAALGRTPHLPPFAGLGERDWRMVEEALARVGLDGFESRRWSSLSGGEQQRVQIARALVQQPRELLLDEPTNHLDIRHQIELLALVRALGLTVVVSLHDLDLAAHFCDRICVLKAGRVAVDGVPAAVLTPALIAEVYGVEAEVTQDRRTGRIRIRYGLG